MLQYSLLHLAGYDSVSMDDLKQFRQWGSQTPGHPENFVTAGVECTTGPLGTGISNAVGFAAAEAHMAAVYNKPGMQSIEKGPQMDNIIFVRFVWGFCSAEFGKCVEIVFLNVLTCDSEFSSKIHL